MPPGQNKIALQPKTVITWETKKEKQWRLLRASDILWEERFRLSLYKWARSAFCRSMGKDRECSSTIQYDTEIRDDSSPKQGQKQLVTLNIFNNWFKKMWSTQSLFLWPRRKHKMLVSSENMQDVITGRLLSIVPAHRLMETMYDRNLFHLEIKRLGHTELKQFAQPVNC